EFRWRLLHRNGNILADSGEGYSSRSNARRAARRVSELAPDSAVDDRFEVYEDAAEEWRWRLRADNGELIADSGEGYANRSKAMDAVERVQSYAADADLLAIGSAAFEVYEDKGEEWRWRLRHRNGEIIADSGEGYAERNKAVAAIKRIKRHAPGATQEE
ncbi:YegP family protein, partial [Haloarcula sp. JP-Z28]|uniref:YegP family protein n=1 Tax=Haloarcula sp. JP-Z28 TaxID=2716715 RepID=UPI0014054B18